MTNSFLVYLVHLVSLVSPVSLTAEPSTSPSEATGSNKSMVTSDPESLALAGSGPGGCEMEMHLGLGG